MTLYEIDERIAQCVDGETGEIIDADALEALQIERDAKIEGVALWYKNLRAEAAACKAEKMAFAERQKAAERKMKSLARWMMEATERSPFRTDKVTVSFRHSRPLNIEEGADIPEGFMRKTYEPDKEAIKRALQSGIEIKGASIGDAWSVQVK